MSDNEQPRDAAGQYTVEPKFGRAAELEAAGYTEMPEAPKDEGKTYGSDTTSLREAADDLAAKQAEQEPQTVERFYQTADGERIDAKQTVTAERAADDLSAYRADIQRYVEGADASAVAEIVDKARSDVLKGRPQDADAYGLDAKEVEANAARAQKAETDTAQEPAAEPAIDGLDPEVQKALKHPQVRQAIEEELGRAETAKQQYSAALNVANQYAQATLLDHFPELQGVPLDQWAQGIAILHQSDPQRVQRAMGVLQRVDQLQTAQAHWQQHQAAQARQQFETWAEAEDQRFEAMPEWSGLAKEERAKISSALVEYASDLGIDRKTFAHLMQTNPVMRHSAFQRMMVDAARYQLVKKAVPKAIPKAVPPVQRPGTSAARTSHAADDVQSLTRTFRASGKVDDAVNLLMARRAAARG